MYIRIMLAVLHACEVHPCSGIYFNRGKVSWPWQCVYKFIEQSTIDVGI